MFRDNTLNLYISYFEVIMRFHHSLLLLLILPLLAVGSCSEPDNRFWPGREWKLGNPADHGIDRDEFTPILDSAANGMYGDMDCLIVVKGGHLLFEEYFGESDRQAPMSVSEITGSFVSALIGIALERGDLKSIDQPIAGLLPDYDTLLTSDTAKGTIRLRDLLTMTSGLQWNQSTFVLDSGGTDWSRAMTARDPVGDLLRRPLVAEPGTTFNESTGNTMLLTAILARATGTPVTSYGAEHLLKPIGIDSGYYWSASVNAMDTAVGLILHPRHLARFGLLYARGGQWHGKQVVPRAWVDSSLAPNVIVQPMNEPDSGGFMAQGYHWWCAQWPGVWKHSLLPQGVVMTANWRGEYVIILPDHDVVVVAVAGSPDEEGHVLMLASQVAVMAAGVGHMASRLSS